MGDDNGAERGAEMTKVDDEMALQFLRLSELGHTYVAIGKRFDVNHRTVSEWVRRGREFSRTRHWQQIGRDQDARYMDEHHQLLLDQHNSINLATPHLHNLRKQKRYYLNH